MTKTNCIILDKDDYIDARHKATPGKYWQGLLKRNVMLATFHADVVLDHKDRLIMNRCGTIPKRNRK